MTSPYAPPVMPPTPIRTNTLAIISLVAAFFVPVAGIVCGYVALSQIRRTREEGRGLALAGIIVGFVYSAFLVLFFILWLGLFVFALSSHGGPLSR